MPVQYLDDKVPPGARSLHSESASSLSTFSDNTSSSTFSDRTSLSSSSSPFSRVQFSTVSIRQYARTISDHPDARGVPIGIDWEFWPESPMSLDEYEAQKLHVLGNNTNNNNNNEINAYNPEAAETVAGRSLRLSSMTREHILKYEWGYTSAEMFTAEQYARKAWRLRQQSARKGWIESMRIKFGK